MKAIAGKRTISDPVLIKYILGEPPDKELSRTLIISDIQSTQDLLKRLLRYENSINKAERIYTKTEQRSNENNRMQL